MKRRLFLSLLLLGTMLHAQGPLLEPNLVPEFERAQDGTFSKMNFSIPLDDISKSGLNFQKFEKNPLLIMYVSATCGHCHHAYPKVSKLVSEYKAKGLEMVVIASSFSKVDDLIDMKDDLKIKEPLFHDKQKKFGELYGLGSVPMIVLVNQQGHYIRYRSFTANVEQQIRAELSRWFASSGK